jgi:hypothetical protein
LTPRTALLCLGLLLAGCAAPPERSPYRIPIEIEPADLAAIPPGAPAYCAPENRAILAKAVIPDIPRWFFKPLPEGPWVAYLGEGGNKLLDLERGLVIPVPGARDPVPTPDGRFLSVPGITLFALQDLLDEAKRPTARGIEIPLHGEYQSPGLLAETASAVTYRFIADDSGPVVRDVTLRLDAPGGASVEAIGQRRKLCPGQRLQLPMLSPDGRELAAYDVEAGSSRIFRIEADYRCTIVTDLGLPTGKLAFSFDGKQVAFHLAHLQKLSVKTSDVPNDRYAHNVFVLDRTSGRIGRLTHNTASNAYYPAYRRDGTLVYLFKPYAASGGRFSFAVADPALIDSWAPLAWVTGECRGRDRSCIESLALGSLWAHVCSAQGETTSPKAAALYTLSLHADSCGRLVHDHWARHRESIGASLRHLPGAETLSGLDADALAAACP